MAFSLSLSPFAAFAGSLSYSGRIVDSTNTAVAGSVSFTVTVKAHNGTCVLYQETQSQTISASANGGFALTINGSASVRNDGTGNSFDAIFSNQGTLSCSAASGGGTYSPAASDKRYVSVTFDDGGGVEALPTQEIAAVPGALESSRVGGFVPASLARVASAGTIAAFSQGEANELTKIIQGTTTQYAKNASNGAIAVGSFAGNPGSPATGQFWYDTSSNVLKYYNGSTVQTLSAGGASVSSVVAGAGLSGGTITTAGTLSLAASGVAAGTYAKLTVDSYGRATSGGTLVEADIPTLSSSGKVVGSAISSGTIGGSTAINTTGSVVTTGSVSAGSVSAALVSGTSMSTQAIAVWNVSNTFKTTISQNPALASNLSMILPATAGTSGQVLTTDGSGNLSWSTVSGGTGGGSGTVTSVVSGAGLTAGTITSIGTLSLADTAVTPGTYGSASQVAQIVVDQKGRVTSGTSVAISGLNASAISAGTLAIAQGGTGLGTAPSAGEILLASGTGTWTLFGCSTTGHVLTWTIGTGFGCAAPSSQWTTSGTNIYYSSGYVGIGTTAPEAKVDVAGGQLRVSVYNAGTSTSIDWNNGNNQYTAPAGNACAVITLSNLLDGGSYTLAVQGVTSGTCTFSSGALSFVYNPGNAAVASDAVYTFLRMGSKVYVSWTTGFQ